VDAPWDDIAMSNDAKIQALIDKWRKILLLDGWDIEWRWEEGLGVDGQIRIHTNEREAKLCLKPSVVQTYNEEQQDKLIAHELVHIILMPIDDLLEIWATKLVPSSMLELFIETLNNVAENRVIEDLIRILRAR